MVQFASKHIVVDSTNTVLAHWQAMSRGLHLDLTTPWLKHPN